MKKMILLVAAVVAFATTSCKKEKTCVCTSKSTVLGQSASAASEIVTKEDCSDFNKPEATMSGVTTSTTCVEK